MSSFLMFICTNLNANCDYKIRFNTNAKAYWKPILKWWASSFKYQMSNIHLKPGYGFCAYRFARITNKLFSESFSNNVTFSSQTVSESRQKRICITIDCLSFEITSSNIYTTSHTKSIHRRTWFLVFAVWCVLSITFALSCA